MNFTEYERTTSYCGQCVAMKRSLDSKGLEYEAKAIEDQPDWRIEENKAEGRMMAPLTVVECPSGGSVTVRGFRPDLVESLEAK